MASSYFFGTGIRHRRNSTCTKTRYTEQLRKIYNLYNLLSIIQINEKKQIFKSILKIQKNILKYLLKYPRKITINYNKLQ